MSEKIAVIGSNSFSGAHFVNHAISEGAQVIGISRSPEPANAFLPYKTNSNTSAFKFFQLDLNTALEHIVAALHDFRPDYVVNFAAQSMVAESWQNPEHWFQTNAVGHVKLHDQLRRMPFLKKYVHISTPEVYGSCIGNVQENAPFNPSTPYAVSRAAGDMSLISFFKNYKFPVVFTRAANVYGPGQQLYRIVPRTILYARMGKTLPLHGGGASVRSFIHIRDVTDGTLKIMRSAPDGEVYHLSTTRQISIRLLVEMIASMTGVRFEDLVENANERPGKDAAYLLDSTKIKTQLGWHDQITLEDGLKETIAWVDANLEDLKKHSLSYEHKP
jgi:dTDP-glucose 4,6-dehydratase